MLVKDFRDVEAKPSGDTHGVSIRWVIGKDDGAPHFAMRVIEVEPGYATPYHRHGWEHEVFILSGRGVVKGNGSEQAFEEGSAIFIPGDELHQFLNTGSTVLRFICMIPHG